MDVMHPRSAGIDVHKEMLMVCVRVLEKGRVEESIRQFSTMTSDILAMADWFASLGVTHVAMESTGVFWKPIYNLLEGRFEVWLCNAHHIKQVPGRKTDVKDCQWIAQLLQLGLLRPSFVPPRPLRDLRDLTRHRAQLTDEKTRTANRIQKVLEDTNIKLSSVASDILGVSGRAMLQVIIAGDALPPPEVLADLARGRLRKKLRELREALRGKVTDHHRFMLRQLWDQLTFVEKQIAGLTARIGEVMENEDATRKEGDPGIPFADAVALLCQIPGVSTLTADNILAEIGTDMTRFPTAKHLASWAGICPGNNESAGKRKHGRTTKGNRWLRRTLTQAAWAASRTKKSYFKAQLKRVSSRRGRKRALVAVAHSLLTVTFHILSTKTPFADLGPEHFDNLNAERLTRHLIRRLEGLGLEVTVKARQSA
jgi:transposase